MLTKKTIFKAVQEEVLRKFIVLESAFSDLNSAVTDDSKSTAGDKHETGRAMVHLEQEKLSQQMTTLNELKETLSKINPEEKHQKIQFGSFVQTNKGNFFFSVGLGKILVGKDTVFCLSMTTPLGKVFAGKKKGNQVTFNGNIEILSVE